MSLISGAHLSIEAETKRCTVASDFQSCAMMCTPTHISCRDIHTYAILIHFKVEYPNNVLDIYFQIFCISNLYLFLKYATTVKIFYAQLCEFVALLMPLEMGPKKMKYQIHFRFKKIMTNFERNDWMNITD